LPAHDLRERAPALPDPANVQPHGASAHGRRGRGLEHGGALFPAHAAGRLRVRAPRQHAARRPRAGGGASWLADALAARTPDPPPAGPTAGRSGTGRLAADVAGGVDRRTVLPALHDGAAAAAVVLADGASGCG